ncbi:hypothetical protein VP01_928g5 [Puccinia sorghi]|uniref:L-ornithine N(5)-monooxygenase [NAD(P)H] n=1 Tax=Puccinia sorghi TaxID=27349 RepID=A0A0L6U744_9BASI|nr:hypothetical protein VP01_928g5 [Puccinia sorghi]
MAAECKFPRQEPLEPRHALFSESILVHKFLKDLVTLRNPCSPFSFLNYLHCHDRLIDFTNRATFTPTRLEFADYLSWVARRVNSSSAPSVSMKTEKISDSGKHHSIDLCYGERVVAVEGVKGAKGDIEFLRVSSTKPSDGSLQQYLCRNLVISVGGTPRVPKPFQDLGFESHKKSCYVLHTSTFLQHVDRILGNLIRHACAESNQHTTPHPICNPELNNSPSPISSLSSKDSSGGLKSYSSPVELAFSDANPSEKPFKIKIAVIGGGQSAAETLLETYHRLKPLVASINGSENCAQIDLIIKQGHLRPSDDSPFSNEVFNPQSTDFFYDLNARELSPRLDRPSSICGTSRLNEFLLKEAAATNYAVVNPETLTTLYETIYSQKVDQGMDRGQFKNWGRSNNVTINIINYTEVIAAEETPSGNGSVDAVLENLLTRSTTRTRYQAVILGTGYSRQSWKEILFGKPAELPGSGINLATLWPNLSTDTLHGYHPSADDSPTNSDIVSSGLSDEHERESCLSEASHKSPSELKISRNYRLLLPETFVELEPSEPNKFRARTHGISDSLLRCLLLFISSPVVLSVRSGEIFDGIQEEGWFGNSSETLKDGRNSQAMIPPL